MSRHIEEEINGPSESASQGLFAHEITRLGRQVRLPKRFEQNQEVLPIAKTGTRKKTTWKRSNQKQPTIPVHEDEALVDEAVPRYQPPLLPAKEFEIEVKKNVPEWVKNFKLTPQGNLRFLAPGKTEMIILIGLKKVGHFPAV